MAEKLMRPAWLDAWQDYPHGVLANSDARELNRYVVELETILAHFRRLHPLSEYQDDDNTVLWWHVPIQEPPYVGAGPGFDERHADGTLTMCARLLGEGWLTHWSRIPQPELPQKDSASAVEP